MFGHLVNCHGEWNAALTIAASLPLAGIWLRLKIAPMLTRGIDDEH